MKRIKEQCDGCLHDVYESDTNAQYCNLDMGEEYYEGKKECPEKNYGPSEDDVYERERDR